jgi:hypothetical protein
MKLSLKNRAQAFTPIELPVVLVTLALVAAILLTARTKPAHHHSGIKMAMELFFCLTSAESRLCLGSQCWDSLAS